MSHSDDVKIEVEIGTEVDWGVKGPGTRGSVQGLGASIKTVTAWKGRLSVVYIPTDLTPIAFSTTFMTFELY
jgi:hypothetical protein